MLVTELRAPGALVRLTDDLPLRSGADPDEDAPAGCGELLRLVEVLEGPRGSDLDHAARGRGARERDRLTAPFELWTRAPVPEGPAHWRDALSRCAEAGATGVLVRSTRACWTCSATLMRRRTAPI